MTGSGRGQGTAGLGHGSGVGGKGVGGNTGLAQHHQQAGTGAAGGPTVQCGPHQYRLGLYGWRRRCLYALILVLLVMVILNLALTLFILRVLDFTTDGMGGLQIVKGGVVATGDVHVMDSLVATSIISRPHTPIRILAANNFTIAATDSQGKIANTIFMDEESMQCTSEKLVIKNKAGRQLFVATKDRVLVGARHLTVSGEGGAVFSGSVQTPHVTAPVGQSLMLESATRSLEISAPQGVMLESRAGTITAHCLNDFTLQSTGGHIKFDTSKIYLAGLRTSKTEPSPELKPADVYQVCVCSNGRLFLAKPEGVCASDQEFCK